MEATDIESELVPLNRYSVVFNDMQSHYNTLLGTVPGVVYTLDEKGHFTYVSSCAESVLGYSLNDLIGRHFSYIIYPDDVCMVSRDHILPRFAGVPTGVEKAPKLFDERRSFNRKTSGLNVRIRLRPADTTDNQLFIDEKVANCKVNASGQYINKDGEPHFCGTVGFIFDVATDNSMAAALESRKRYNALDLLSHALSHAFSNVFTGIYGNLQLMEMQLAEGKQITGNIEAIKHSVENAVSLIKQVTQSLSDAQIQRTSDSLRSLISEIALETFCLPGQIFDCKSVEDIWDYEMDPDYLSHISRSVFFHASYAAGPNAVVRCKISNCEENADDFPRQDCLYIKIGITFALPQEPDSQKQTTTDEYKQGLTKIASLALKYTLVKKTGSLIEVNDSGNSATVNLYIPSRRKMFDI
jgi:hypothetical protein